MTLEAKGVSFVARRADAGREFLTSTDNWFRPCQFANGPDGCLYVVDMYRELIETVESIPPEILKHLQPRSGFDRGRIWRIVPENFVRRPAPRLSRATTAELVALLDHANGWHRDTASRLLCERADRAAIPLLETLAGNAKTPQGRVHALASLAGFDALSETLVVDAMNDTAAPVREHAVKLGERFADRPAIRAAWTKRAADADLRVRWQVAFSLGASADPAATETLARLAIADGADAWFRFAILTSARDRAADLVRRLVPESDRPHVRLLLVELTNAIALARRDDDIGHLLQTLETLPAGALLSRELMTVLLAKLPAEGRDRLKSAPVRAVLAELLERSQRIANDTQQPPADRAVATRNLRLGSFADVRLLCSQLLQPTQPEPVQRAAIEALASFNEPDAASVLLDAWPSLTPAVRAGASEAILSRPASILQLLERIERGSIKTSELDPARIALLRQASEPALRARLEKAFAGVGLSKRTDVLTAYKGALDRAGDVERGRVVFRKHCTACHRREGVGEQLGADLAGIQQRGPAFLLTNILDPNREVLPKFLAYQAQTIAGRSVTGLIQDETATGLTIRRLDGVRETIPRTDLELLRSAGLSFMPEGFETQISVEQMADLIAYLLATP